MPRPISDKIQKLEYQLAKIKFINQSFPDAKFSEYSNPASMTFYSKLVNSIYTQYSFEKDSWGVSIIPYVELDFDYQGKNETIRVFSSPRRNNLVYLSWKRINGKKVLKFRKFVVNLKRNNFRDDILNACRTQIMLFIQEHGDCHLDTKHLEPKLKQLLSFV